MNRYLKYILILIFIASLINWKPVISSLKSSSFIQAAQIKIPLNSFLTKLKILR
jgi:hypothetical protein